jgi:glucuronate isomerase
VPVPTRVLHEDRCFDPDPATRRVARELHAETRDLPIVSPHGHVDPQLLADNEPFPDAASLLVAADHYITRMLHSRGVSLDALGIPRRDGKPVETDPRRVWQIFADHYHLFLGTPSRFWIDYQLHDVFGVQTPLRGDTGMRVYDELLERLRTPEFRPRALFTRFNIEVLATTDGAAESLDHHRAIRESGWSGRVIPTFRPDALFHVASAEWIGALEQLARADGAPILDCAGFIAALERRRAFFRSHGATATDHAVVEPWTGTLAIGEAERIFQRGREGTATAEDQRRFVGHLMIEMARMSVADGLVMQLHAGALRDHDLATFDRFGADRGGDIPVMVEFTRNLRALLNAFGNDPRFTLILFTLDEATYSRELAPLAGHYPAVRLGPPWWFHDSMQGMTRFREQTIASAGIWKTAGFNDDTRAFCSIPARHDLARRVDANFLAGLVARHVLDVGDARVMARAMAYDLARETYRLR